MNITLRPREPKYTKLKCTKRKAGQTSTLNPASVAFSNIVALFLKPTDQLIST